MPVVAYLLNRYPEMTLSTVCHEVAAVRRAGVSVRCFAHRPSKQPLTSDASRAEASQTEYLGQNGLGPLFFAVICTGLTRPARLFWSAMALPRLSGGWGARLGHLAIACRLVRRLRINPVDFLHAHFAGNAAGVALLAGRLGGPPWSLTIHGPEDLEEGNQTTLRTLAREADCCVAISTYAARAVRRAAEPALVDVRVVGMGVGAAFLEEPRLPIPVDGPLVCVARLDKRKGHRLLFEALNQIAQDGLTPKLELIGGGPLEDDLRAQVVALGLGERVTFCGWMDSDALRRRLDAARAVVLPSLGEGLPVSLMEALARARPVIATAVAGVGELVRDGETGVLVQPGDVDSLAAGLTRVLRAPIDVLQRMGDAGHRAVSQHHDAGLNAEKLVELWFGTTKN